LAAYMPYVVSWQMLRRYDFHSHFTSLPPLAHTASPYLPTTAPPRIVSYSTPFTRLLIFWHRDPPIVIGGYSYWIPDGIPCCVYTIRCIMADATAVTISIATLPPYHP